MNTTIRYFLMFRLKKLKYQLTISYKTIIKIVDAETFDEKSLSKVSNKVNKQLNECEYLSEIIGHARSTMCIRTLRKQENESIKEVKAVKQNC